MGKQQVNRPGNAVLASILKNAVAIAPIRPDSFDVLLHYNLWSAFDAEHTLYHYIKLEYFRKLITSSRLRFGRLDLYKDAYEGRFPAANLTQNATVTENLLHTFGIKRDAHAFVASQNIARNYCYIHCWFGNDTETKLMWEKYGDHRRGVCIRSSTSRIKKALIGIPTFLHLHPGKVTYSDEATPISTLFSLAPAFRKNPKYQDECEYRLLAEYLPDHEPKDSQGNFQPAPEFQMIGISMPKMFEEILIGPDCPVDEIGQIMELVSKYVPGTKVSPSRFWKPAKI